MKITCPKCGAERIRGVRCAPCKKEYQQAWREANPDYKRQWYMDHPEYNKVWRSRNREKWNEYSQTWRDKNPQYLYEWRKKHPSYSIDRHNSNPEKGRSLARIWRATNIDRATANAHNYRASRLGVAGTFTGENWASVKESQGNSCAGCFTSNVNLEVDHKVPLSKGGTNHIGNIQALCCACNKAKANKLTCGHIGE